MDFGSIAMVLWTTHVYLSQLLTNTGTILSRCTLQQPIVLSHSIKCVVYCRFSTSISFTQISNQFHPNIESSHLLTMYSLAVAVPCVL